VCPVAALDFELVVLAAVGTTKEVEHLAAHAETVVAAAAAGFHSGMIVPDLACLSRLAGSTLLAPPHSA
jgi:hypothetical protein